MTQRLYYTDAYCRSFDAVVVRALDHGGHPAAVLDRSALFQEFRIRHNIECDGLATRRELRRDRRAHLVGGTNRHRGFVDDHRVARERGLMRAAYSATSRRGTSDLSRSVTACGSDPG